MQPNFEQFFAFSYRPPLDNAGWSVYNPEQEYERQGLSLDVFFNRFFTNTNSLLGGFVKSTAITSCAIHILACLSYLRQQVMIW